MFDRSTLAVLAAPPAQAVIAYRSALQRWGGSLSLQMGLGNALYAAGDKAGAAQAFEAATTRHPDSAPAWMNLASTRAELGQRDGFPLGDPDWRGELLEAG